MFAFLCSSFVWWIWCSLWSPLYTCLSIATIYLRLAKHLAKQRPSWIVSVLAFYQDEEKGFQQLSASLHLPSPSPPIQCHLCYTTRHQCGTTYPKKKEDDTCAQSAYFEMLMIMRDEYFFGWEEGGDDFSFMVALPAMQTSITHCVQFKKWKCINFTSLFGPIFFLKKVFSVHGRQDGAFHYTPPQKLWIKMEWQETKPRRR